MSALVPTTGAAPFSVTTMKALRWLLLALVAIAAAIALAPLIPLGPLRPVIEARLSEFFNHEVEIGSMRLSLLGGPYLTMKRVTIKMAPEFGAGNLLEAEKVSANLAALRLLGGDLKIDALEFESPQVSLVRNPGGVWNWTALGQRSAAVRPSLPVILMIAPTGMAQAAVISSLEKFCDEPLGYRYAFSGSDRAGQIGPNAVRPNHEIVEEREKAHHTSERHRQRARTAGSD